jgi:predicted acylesterase/phospholipase RssA
MSRRAALPVRLALALSVATAGAGAARAAEPTTETPALEAGPAASGAAIDTATSPGEDGVHTVLCFSGGGTRAAAFALGVARALAELDAAGGPLLTRVDRVVGVSGGSLTAAQVALDSAPAALDAFERRVLREDLERAMVRSAASQGWDLVARELTRGDVAAGCFGDRLPGGSFAALPARPELWVQTTDFATGRPRVLSRDGLAAAGHDPAAVPVVRALAASAAFPGIFPPVRLEAPGADGAGVGSAAWLGDGGIVDNLGLEPTLDAWEAGPPPGARALLLVVVNARCGLPPLDEAGLGSSVRTGLHVLELQQRRLDDLHLARARDRLRLLELEARLAGRPLVTRLVVLDFAGSTRREALDAIPTRFALDDAEVNFLVEEGRAVARARLAGVNELWVRSDASATSSATAARDLAGGR